MWRNIAALLLLSSVLCSAQPVRTVVHARWAHTPLLLEASEFLSSISDAHFWLFVDSLADTPTYATDKDEYALVMDRASRVVGAELQPLLSFSLGLREFSPAVQFAQQVAEEKLAGSDCTASAAFVLLQNGHVTCDPQTLQKDLETAASQPATEDHVFEFDHVRGGYTANQTVPFLYGHMATPAFHGLLSALDAYRQAHAGFKYAVRHYVQGGQSRRMRVGGYGIELAIKNMEYRAVDDRTLSEEEAAAAGRLFAEEKGEWEEDTQQGDVEGLVMDRLKELHPDHTNSLDALKENLTAQAELVQLKESQLRYLGLQAVQLIVQAGPNALKVLRDLAQNFPSRASSLANQKVARELKIEAAANRAAVGQAFGMDGLEGLLLVNGVNMPLDRVDPYQLSERIRADAILLQGLSDLGVPLEVIHKLLATTDPFMEVEGEQRQPVLVDVRSNAIQWFNNIEKDKAYSSWPKSLAALKQPSMFNQVPQVRRNLVHGVFVLRPSDPIVPMALEIAKAFVQYGVPLRVGFLFYTDKATILPKKLSLDVHEKDESTEGEKEKGAKAFDVAVMRLMSYVSQKKDRKAAFAWLEEVVDPNKRLSIERLRGLTNKRTKESLTLEQIKAITEGTDYDTLRATSDQFVSSSGLALAGMPCVYVNGRQVPADREGLDQYLYQITMQSLGELRRAVWQGEITDETSSVYDWVLSKPTTVPRINPAINSATQSLGTIAQPAEDDPKNKAQLAGAVLDSLVYFTAASNEAYTDEDDTKEDGSSKDDNKEDADVTHIVVGDLDTAQGLRLAFEGLKYLHHNPTGNRVSILHSGAPTTPGSILSQLLVALAGSKGSLSASAALLAEAHNHVADSKTLNIDSMAAAVRDSHPLLNSLAALIDDLKNDKPSNLGMEFASKVLGLASDRMAFVTNGRVYVQEPDDLFVAADFSLAEKRSRAWLDEVKNTLNSNRNPDSPSNGPTPDSLFRIMSLLGSQGVRRISLPKHFQTEHSMVHLEAPPTSSLPTNVVVFVDPLSKQAQRIVQPLIALHQAVGASIHLHLLPKEELTEMPLKRFYRSALHGTPQFSASGKLVGPSISFTGLPREPLLTLAVDAPSAWDVEAVSSVYDLDNIHLKTVASVGVMATFVLAHILVEGRCYDDQFQPTRGLQLDLGTKRNPHVTDTLVMANLGYFQLKAWPGLWRLFIRPGRSTDLYTLMDGTNGTDVALRSFSGILTLLRTKKRPGKEGEDLLEEIGEEGKEKKPDEGLWSSLSGLLRKEEEQHDVINVFSLASGHLYERFLSLMMVSVMRHTQSRVKFWLLEGPLSPKFKKFIPHLAAKYGFEYAFVSYNWPFWLNAQTEKQRIIWGYKILFLDVLFPLDVKRVIFVDADQTVRADLKELMTMDLHGAPYGYTPFCGDRPEMAKYRFWDQGYWANHLRGKPYHISALYVIDLVRFRQMAAGDVLRAQYHQLSQDPNSLANLDQDLPNQMIHRLPIFSLPQEWLWCETWCSDKTKKKAKTIDLCNNPETKEPKLKAAVRIVSEWVDYDRAVAELRREVQPKMDETQHRHEEL